MSGYAVVLHSGGLDSSVLLAHAKSLAYSYGKSSILSLSVLYGQRHIREVESAWAIAEHYGVENLTIDIEESMRPCLGGSALTSDDIPVPRGHYADETMKTTIVPNRNMLLLSIATAIAVSQGYDLVAYAAHVGDHPIYADCRPDFIDAMRQAVSIASNDEVILWTPFAGSTKQQIVELGVKLDVPFGSTWSCYEGGVRHCGKCGTCIERAEAFQLAGIPDPTLYEEA